jgi:hypothetical protein
MTMVIRTPIPKTKVDSVFGEINADLVPVVNDNDNGNEAEQPVEPLTGNALTSLSALALAFNKVDRSNTIGRSSEPMMQFKRDGDGTWYFGQERTIVQEGSQWAFNPPTFKWGYISWNDANKVVGSKSVSVFEPKPDPSMLQDTGFPWQEEWTVMMKCINGDDAGMQVIFKTTTVGGRKALAKTIDAIRDRLNKNQHGGKVVPVGFLEKSSYTGRYGLIWEPEIRIVGWISMGGPNGGGGEPKPKPVAPSAAPKPSPSPSMPPRPAAAAAVEQPRRRRVGA